MAAKIFSITGAGTSNAQVLDDNTICIHVIGDIGQGQLYLEASPSNNAASFANVPALNGQPLSVNTVQAISLPGNWYVRVKLLNPVTTPVNATLTIV